MSVAPGTRIGPYEVVVLIGVGGMGEVYRATDTNLGRQVAIKVLPEAFASDPERLARFEREAKTLAVLNHPNIAIIHGLEKADGIRALVMELVEGPTLADRIAQRPIPVEEALPIAKQIVEALEAAHEQGIIHRDLKPANIKLRPDGTVKVLDFGLAKALEPRSLTGIDATASPTITSPAIMTGVGMLLGTAAYMSPEQAKGRAADKRSDVWAFGCVLYEMLAGRRAFDAEDVSDTFALVLKGEPDWTTLPADLHWLVSVFIHRCLEKDRRKRIADISTALFVLDQAGRVLSERLESRGQKDTASVPIPLWRRAIPIILAAVLAGVVVGIAAWRLQPVTPVPTVTRFLYTLPEGQAFTDAFLPSVAISPDGTHMAYVANQRLYLRSMSELEARPIPGTETQTNMGSPVFSPDGRAIAYWTRTGPPAGRLTRIPGALRRIATTGGASVTIGQVDHIPLGLRWDRDAVLFGQVDHGIVRIPASGGTPEVLLKGKTGEATSSPQLLPGGEAVLFTVATSEDGTVTFQETWDQAQIVVQSLKSGERKTLITGGSDARYLPTGHLVYALGGVLFAVPFDVKRLAVTGGPVPVVEGVLRTGFGPLRQAPGISALLIADQSFTFPDRLRDHLRIRAISSSSIGAAIHSHSSCHRARTITRGSRQTADKSRFLPTMAMRPSFGCTTCPAKAASGG